MNDKAGLQVPKKGYKLLKSRSTAVLLEGIWHNNPIFGMVLGICSTLAVTNLMTNALVMSLAVTVVLVINSGIVSLIRNQIPDRVRMIAYMFIASTLVITVDVILKIILPGISKSLGPYVALIITNCILMGRAEAFAINNTFAISVLDALGTGAGYTLSLLTISFFREILGFGTVFGFRIIPGSLTPAGVLSIPPGAFFALGTFILVCNVLRKKGKE